MGWPVITVASGGMPVVDVTATTGRGTPVTEATNKFGCAVTKVASGGMAVAYETLTTWPLPSVTYATWDPAVAANVTLSGGNLVVTNNSTSIADQGAKVAQTSEKTSGKYYFEITFTVTASSITSATGFGIGTSASTYTNLGSGGPAVIGDRITVSGTLAANGINNIASLSQRFSGDKIGIAADLDNRNIWFRVAPGGNWNNSGTANPATNVGGIAIPAGAMVPFCVFNGSGTAVNNVHTANFGASAFTGAVPSGFTAGWPA